ncbi:hypothetical protein [Luteibacter yeojuensis]
MANGNHVFNDFESCIVSCFVLLLEQYKLERHFNALNGSGGDMAEGRRVMNSKFATSYPLLLEIRAHPRMRERSWIQDDERVEANDHNSIEFGKKAKDFKDVFYKWVCGLPADPMMAWRDIVNAGQDPAARTGFIGGSSLAQAPKSSEARRELCRQVELFIRGDLTRLVAKWLIAIRQDLSTAGTVEYAGDETAWRNVLRRGLAGWSAEPSAR